MGGGVSKFSTAQLPARLTKEQAAELCGEHYDESLFDSLADDSRTITKDQLLKLLSRTDVFLSVFRSLSHLIFFI
jgi:TnpA family transposase